MKYRNAKYIDDTRIDCEIEHPEFGWIPYLLDPADTDMTVNNDDLLAAMASAGDVAGYTPPTQEAAAALKSKEVRRQRDCLLVEMDAIIGNPLRWAALDTDTQAAWGSYRQALLDVPQQVDFPHNASWPVRPS